MQSVLKEKKRFLVINPNTGQAMTRQIEESLQGLLPEEVRLEVVTNIAGPVSIEGYTDEVISAYHILKLIAEKQDEYDGYLIACFSNHPSIAMLRELTGKPVVGIAEAACHMAAMTGNKFGIVTTSPRWVPMLEEAVGCFGMGEKCAGVLSTGLRVAELQSISREQMEDAILHTGRLALSMGAETLCLGCAGMSGLQERIEKELKVPVVDSCKAGLMLLYSLCVLGLKTSRLCAYAPNDPRETVNLEEDVKKFYRI